MPEDPTVAEERRAEQERLIAERNRAQRDAEADGSEEQVLLLPPEGYAVPGDEEEQGYEEQPAGDEQRAGEEQPAGDEQRPRPGEYPTPT